MGNQENISKAHKEGFELGLSVINMQKKMQSKKQLPESHHQMMMTDEDGVPPLLPRKKQEMYSKTINLELGNPEINPQKEIKPE